MTEARRELEAFARTVEALGPYLDDLVFVGGWARYLYTLMLEAAPLGFTPLTTDDADVAAPPRLRVRSKTIPELLVAAGFEQRLSGDHIPPVAEYRPRRRGVGILRRVPSAARRRRRESQQTVHARQRPSCSSGDCGADSPTASTCARAEGVALAQADKEPASDLLKQSGRASAGASRRPQRRR
jgi:hypothetical protein